MENIDSLIEKKKQVVSLLEEYKEAAMFEHCTHSIQQWAPGRFMLFEIATKTEIAHGDKATMRKWVSRKTSPEFTYNYHLVEDKTITN